MDGGRRSKATCTRQPQASPEPRAGKVRAPQALQPAQIPVLPEHSMPQGAGKTPHSRSEGRENNIRSSALSVPFPSPLEADIARGSLAPDVEPHREVVQKEFTVNGSVLAVHWRAEDSRLLRTSILNFLDQLSLVMRTMQRFGPPLPR